MYFVNFSFSKESHDVFCWHHQFFSNFRLFCLLAFDAIPQDAQNQNQEFFLTCWCMFWWSLVVIKPFFTYLWLPMCIPFLSHFFTDQTWTSSSPVAPDHQSSNFYYLLNNCCRGSERGDTECIYHTFFLSFFFVFW